METHYIPTTIGPSKLDLLLVDAPELSDENKSKIILIIDIERVCKLLGSKPITPKNFFDLYDAPIEYLETVQHDLQVVLNTKEYHSRIQGADF